MGNGDRWKDHWGRDGMDDNPPLQAAGAFGVQQLTGAPCRNGA
jgi:hypothetical protein